MKEAGNRPGLIDLSNRVLRELLRTPKFKAKVKVLLDNLDPAAAPELVRTLMWEDPELFLDLVGASPQLLNAVIKGGREFTEQMAGIPSPLLAGFLSQVIDRLDGETLGALIAAGPELCRRVMEVPGGELQRSLAGFGEKMSRGMGRSGESPAEVLLAVLEPFLKSRVGRLAEEAKQEDSETAKLIRGLSRTLAEALRENPDFITYVCKPFIEAFGTDKNVRE